MRPVERCLCLLVIPAPCIYTSDVDELVSERMVSGHLALLATGTGHSGERRVASFCSCCGLLCLIASSIRCPLSRRVVKRCSTPFISPAQRRITAKQSRRMALSPNGSTRLTLLPTSYLANLPPDTEVTLDSLVQAQERLADEAKEAMPYAFDECSYEKGYLRQSVWSCIGEPATSHHWHHHA